MHCPVDHSELASHPKAENDVLGCKECRGLWLSKRGVHAAWQHANGRAITRPGFYWHRNQSAQPNGRKCPMCADTEMTQSLFQTIEYEVCPKCEGIWFDNGELDAILKWYRLNKQSAFSKTNVVAAAGAAGYSTPHETANSLIEIFKEICYQAPPDLVVDLAVAVFRFIIEIF